MSGFLGLLPRVLQIHLESLDRLVQILVFLSQFFVLLAQLFHFLLLLLLRGQGGAAAAVCSAVATAAARTSTAVAYALAAAAATEVFSEIFGGFQRTVVFFVQADED